VFFGPLHEPSHGEARIGDMNGREMLAIVPICVLCLWIGVMPQPWLRVIKPDVDAIAALYAPPSPVALAERPNIERQPAASDVVQAGSAAP
jgi:NADH-quinone oxidoreductase subunit M